MNTKYIFMILYDIEMNSPSKLREYRKFKKNLDKSGYSMVQESVYIKQINDKSQAKRLGNEISLNAPKYSNIRGLILTQSMYESIEVLSGKLEFNEKILRKENKVIEL